MIQLARFTCEVYEHDEFYPYILFKFHRQLETNHERDAVLLIAELHAGIVAVLVSHNPDQADAARSLPE